MVYKYMCIYMLLEELFVWFLFDTNFDLKKRTDTGAGYLYSSLLSCILYIYSYILSLYLDDMVL